MIESEIEKLVRVPKQQAEIFLLDAKEFYPFGTYINMKDEIVPVGAYTGEDEHPLSQDVIDLFEKGFIKKIQNGECKIGAIALDIYINENSEKYDAIESRFFEHGKEVYKKYFRYSIKDMRVEFY
jgi:hypothetical protein